MLSVDDYIFSLEGEAMKIVQKLDTMLALQLGLESKIRYKIPFYYNRSWICYINPQKKGGVELAFLRGNEMSNLYGYLDLKGRKQVMGISFYESKEIKEDILMEIIAEAILLDEQVPYIKRRSKKDN